MQETKEKIDKLTKVMNTHLSKADKHKSKADRLAFDINLLKASITMDECSKCNSIVRIDEMIRCGGTGRCGKHNYHHYVCRTCQPLLINCESKRCGSLVCNDHLKTDLGKNLCYMCWWDICH